MDLTVRNWILVVGFLSLLLYIGSHPRSDEPSFLLEMIDKINSPLLVDEIDGSEMPQEQQPEDQLENLPTLRRECDAFCKIDKRNKEGDLSN